jgi:hypothetical protein
VRNYLGWGCHILPRRRRNGRGRRAGRELPCPEHGDGGDRAREGRREESGEKGGEKLERGRGKNRSPPWALAWNIN